MNPTFRLSRIEAPRTTAWSVALLIFASIVFGVWTLSAQPIAAPMAANDGGATLDGTIARLAAHR